MCNVYTQFAFGTFYIGNIQAEDVLLNHEYQWPLSKLNTLKMKDLKYYIRFVSNGVNGANSKT